MKTGAAKGQQCRPTGKPAPPGFINVEFRSGIAGDVHIVLLEPAQKHKPKNHPHHGQKAKEKNANPKRA